MNTIGIVVGLLIVLCAAPISATELVLVANDVPPGEIASLGVFGLWFSSPESSTAKFLGEGFHYRKLGGFWQNDGNFGGYLGPEPLQKWIEIGIDPGWIGPALHTFSLTLKFQGEAGLFYYVTGDEVWVMPLNSDQFIASTGQGVTELAEYTWHVVSTATRLFLGDQPVTFELRPDVEMDLQALFLNESSIWWNTSHLNLHAGETQIVSLGINGDTGLSEVELCAPSILYFGSRWYLNGEEVLVERKENSLVISLPPLPPGEYCLDGEITALLPLMEIQDQIYARWQGESAMLPVTIGRGFFSQTAKVRVQVSQGNRPLANVPILLPTGEICYTDEKGVVVGVVPEGLQLLYCLGETMQPIWVVTHLGSTTTVTVEMQVNQGNAEYFVPSIVVGSDRKWQISTQFAHGQFNIIDGAPSFTGQMGNWQFSGEDGQMSVVGSYLFGQPHTRGNWSWHPGRNGWQGQFNKSGLTFGITVPVRGLPQASLKLTHGGWMGRYHADQLTLSYATARWRVGYRSTGFVWFDLLKPSMRIERSTNRFAFRWRPFGEQNLQVSIGKSHLYPIDLEIDSQKWKFFFRKPREAPWSSGFSMNVQRDAEHGSSSTEISLFAIPEQLITEMSHKNTWQVTEATEIYLHGQIQIGGPKPRVSWETGLQLALNSFTTGTIAWHSTEQLRWEIGVAFPLSASNQE